MNDAALLACTASVWEGGTDCCRWCDALLPKGRRRWCSDRCADEFSWNHFWTSARSAAGKRDGYKCVRCGERWDEVHHKTPILGRHGQTGCHHHLDGLECLCKPHHLEAHAELRAAARPAPIEPVEQLPLWGP